MVIWCDPCFSLISPLAKRHYINYTSVKMTRLHLGEFEQLLLLALTQLGPDASGVDVRELIERRTGRTISPGAIYTAMQRLERRGFVSADFGEPTPQRGGKRKRHYELAPLGLRALQASYRSIRSMADGIEHLLGEPA